MKALLLFTALIAAPVIQAADHPASPADEAPVKLPPFIVRDTSLLNMGARIRANMDRNGAEATVKSFVIVSLGPRSRLKKAELQIGDNILRINGTLVKGLNMSELTKLLMLKKGQSAKVLFEIQSKGENTQRTVEVDVAAPAGADEEEAPSEPAVPSAASSRG